MLFLYACLLPSLHSALPGVLHHQGRIAIDGVNHDGTGYFKFAFIDKLATQTYWSNTGFSGAGTPEPTTAVAIPVVKGHYAIGLGEDFGTPFVSPAIFQDNDSVLLRIWFSTTGNPGTFEQLTPDRRLTSTPYAFNAAFADTAAVADSLPEGALTSDMLADGAVTVSKLSPGYFSNAQDFTDPFAGFELDPTTGQASYNTAYDQAFAEGTNPDLELPEGWTVSQSDETGFTAGAAYTPVRVDETGDVGSYTSMAIVDGRPAISYYEVIDPLNGRLKFAINDAADGSGNWSTVIVDQGGDVGAFTALAIVDGRPAISYYESIDASNGRLKFAINDAVDGLGNWTSITVDQAGNVGRYSSLALINGRPAISYYESIDSSTGHLKFAINDAADGSGSWSTVTVDQTGDAGAYTSMAIVDGRPAISYYEDIESVNGRLKFAINEAPDGSGNWSTIIIDETGDAGAYTSLSIIDGRPAISYYDSFNSALKFAINTAPDGSGNWFSAIVDVTGNVGRHNSLALIEERAAISYYDTTNNSLKFAINAAPDGSGSWSTVSVDQTGNVGYYTSLALIEGGPAISYRDQSTADLKFVRLPALPRWTATSDTAHPILALSAKQAITADVAESVSDGAVTGLDSANGNFTDVVQVSDEGFVGINNFAPTTALDVGGTVQASAFQSSGGPLKISTTDSNALQFFVNNTLALELSYPTGGGAIPNIIGGYSGNSIAAGRQGSVISGGGSPALENRVEGEFSDFSVIGGGSGNIASEFATVVSGGVRNSAGGLYSVVSGGSNNTASGFYSVTSGGSGNSAGGHYSVVSGGIDNTASGLQSVVSGGALNEAGGDYAAVSGGQSNAANANFSFAAGRRAKANHTGAFVWADSTDADFASIVEDEFAIRADGGVRIVGNALIREEQLLHLKFDTEVGTEIRGGLMIEYDVTESRGGNDRPGIIIKSPYNSCGHLFFDNAADPNELNEFNYNHLADQFEFMRGSNKLMVIKSVTGNVGIGTNNPQAALDVAGTVRATAFEGTETGSVQFEINGSPALRLSSPTTGTAPNIIGGYSANSIASGNEGSVIGGGGSANSSQNIISADSDFSVISGGSANTVTGSNAVVGGGSDNSAGPYAVAGGGFRSNATGDSSVVGGGSNNTASGSNSVVVGGSANTASGDFSFAAGRRAKANHAGAFVWADTVDADFASTAINQFAIRADGGVRIFAPTDPTLLLQSDGVSEYSGRISLRQSNNTGYDIVYDGASDVLAFESFTSGDPSPDGYSMSMDLDGNTSMNGKVTVSDFDADLSVLTIENTSTGPSGDGLTIRIGPTSNPGAGNNFLKLEDGDGTLIGQVDGTGTGGVAYKTTSDRRLKQEIVDLPNALAVIEGLRPREYAYRSAPQIRQVGFIAQEVAEAFPQAATGNPDGDVEKEPMMVDYSVFTPVLTGAVQELNAQVESQKSQISALRAESAALRGENTALEDRLERLEARLEQLDFAASSN